MIIENDKQQLKVQNADISKSSLTNVNAEGMTIRCANIGGVTYTDVCMAGTLISDANMSDITIDGAQLGGAVIRNIGLPPEGHHAYKPGEKQRPLKFENCTLHDSTFTNCDLSHVRLEMCDITGLTINGIRIDELLERHGKA
ncbi:pentapeptide repeat-containing protein [Paenibacillus sp. GYB004]|uniref:pentapeptide repeat-containing protein n=1 Tax=Paenibacillus sp. GYB004 TaxID=2994393 RepID=UPI002F9623C5